MSVKMHPLSRPTSDQISHADTITKAMRHLQRYLLSTPCHVDWSLGARVAAARGDPGSAGREKVVV